jgi:hypothetical protein
MSDYVELPFNKKLNLLNAHDISGEWTSLDETRWCLHCRKRFTGRQARVWKDKQGRLWLECGTPGCDGSPIDWAPYPWWDENHPATRAYLANPPEPKRRRKGRKHRNDGDVPF